MPNKQKTLGRVRKAVIPAAGLGTRFLPATKIIPKEMIPIIDKPMIQYIVEECVSAGIEQIILVTARGKESIVDHFESLEAVSTSTNFIIVRQKERLGLGHAVLTARVAVGDEPFAVVLGDDLVVSKKACIQQLIEVFETEQKSTIGVMEVPPQEVSKYGIVGGKKINNRLFEVNEMVEKPDPKSAPSCLACPGRYVLSPRVFDFLQNAKPGRGGEIQLTDALARLALDEGLLAYLFEGTRYDAGDKLGYIEATIAFALKRQDLAAGVRKLLAQYREQ